MKNDFVEYIVRMPMLTDMPAAAIRIEGIREAVQNVFPRATVVACGVNRYGHYDALSLHSQFRHVRDALERLENLITKPEDENENQTKVDTGTGHDLIL